MLVGFPVGWLVGWPVVGACDGTVLALPDGWPVGACDGMLLGLPVGWLAGWPDGEVPGWATPAQYAVTLAAPPAAIARSRNATAFCLALPWAFRCA